MNTKKINRRVAVAGGVIIIGIASLAIGLALHHHNTYTPTTLAHIQHPATKTACLQTVTNPQVHISDNENTSIGNAAATSIIDVPAGTNVDVYFKTYTSSKATGSAVYSGSYGTYNFVAEHNATNSDDYTGGWKITHFEACKR